MSSELKSKETGKRKIEVVFHIFFMGMAVLGCILNVRSLSKRKEMAVLENIEIFKGGYIKGIAEAGARPAAEIELPRIFKSFSLLSDELGLSYHELKFVIEPAAQLDFSTADIDPNHPLLKLIEDLLHKKIRNPFLFGFRDIGIEITHFLDEIFKKKDLGNGFKENQAVRMEIENFFKSHLTQEQYIDVFSMFYFLVMDAYSEIDIKKHMREGKGIALDKNEYIIAACYLGEIVSTVLGSPVHAFEFLPPTIKITEKEFEESRTRKTLNAGSVKF